MIEEKETLRKAVPNQQVLASDDDGDFSRNAAHSPRFKDAILFLTSSAIQKAFWKSTSSVKDWRDLVNSEKIVVFECGRRFAVFAKTSIYSIYAKNVASDLAFPLCASKTGIYAGNVALDLVNRILFSLDR